MSYGGPGGWRLASAARHGGRVSLRGRGRLSRLAVAGARVESGEVVVVVIAGVLSHGTSDILLPILSKGTNYFTARYQTLGTHIILPEGAQGGDLDGPREHGAGALLQLRHELTAVLILRDDCLTHAL